MDNFEQRFSLKAKTILLVGGHGLYGDALATALAESGAVVYLAARNISALKELESCLVSRKLKVSSLALDLSSPQSIDEMVATLLQSEKRIDVLVNNAVARPMKSFNDDIEAFAKSMQVNATGLFQLTRAIGNHMAVNQAGSIINIGSMQGMVGPDATLYQNLDMTGYIPDYFFHKGGMLNLTRFFASYYGQYGIRCNCISPGGVYADRLHPEFVHRYNQRTMLGRMASPEDITGLVIFLASDASSYITGTNIPVDGGYTAK